MLDQRRVAAQPDENCEHSFREQMFIERYANLRVWAMYLTHHESTADDLVHDLYVQWMFTRPRLEEIETIDGYLRTILRNIVRRYPSMFSISSSLVRLNIHCTYKSWTRSSADRKSVV